MRRRAASLPAPTLILVTKDRTSTPLVTLVGNQMPDQVEADSMTPPNADSLLQMIGQNDEKHDAAHERLRYDLRALEAQVDAGFQALRASDATLLGDMKAMAATPVDVAKLVLAPRLVASIVAAALLMAGGMWASTSGLRSDVRDILTRMEAQKTAGEAVAKVQEVQSITLRAAVDDLKRRQELQQSDIQVLKDAILTGKARTR